MIAGEADMRPETVLSLDMEKRARLEGLWCSVVSSSKGQVGGACSTPEECEPKTEVGRPEPDARADVSTGLMTGSNSGRGGATSHIMPV